jgi:hypothetical protein
MTVQMTFVALLLVETHLDPPSGTGDNRLRVGGHLTPIISKSDAATISTVTLSTSY